VSTTAGRPVAAEAPVDSSLARGIRLDSRVAAGRSFPWCLADSGIGNSWYPCSLSFFTLAPSANRELRGVSESRPAAWGRNPTLCSRKLPLAARRHRRSPTLRSTRYSNGRDSPIRTMPPALSAWEAPMRAGGIPRPRDRYQASAGWRRSPGADLLRERAPRALEASRDRLGRGRLEAAMMMTSPRAADMPAPTCLPSAGLSGFAFPFGALRAGDPCPDVVGGAARDEYASSRELHRQFARGQSRADRRRSRWVYRACARRT
jgi:hypothetical protein